MLQQLHKLIYLSAVLFVVVVVSVGERDYVSALRPPTSLLSIAEMTYEYGEPRLNDIYWETPKNSENNLSEFHFVRHKSHMG
jgi:hypothetical protein